MGVLPRMDRENSYITSVWINPSATEMRFGCAGELARARLGMNLPGELTEIIGYFTQDDKLQFT